MFQPPVLMSSKSSPALDLFGQLEKAAQDMVREAKPQAKPQEKPIVASTGEKPPAPPASPAPPTPPTGGGKAPPPPPPPAPPGGYDGSSIEVLEGLEPVRRRPGMYIGGTDEKALHHLFAEVLDNSMDEAVAGHATFIDIHLAADGFLTVADNGRGIPVDAHPKFPGKSSLEIVMCTLHA
ncbi:MAG: ATP-binding protein, partial [Beijerinckiaceae bacterium]|nr:ATP-binding protein [Beijerinckiaceae bacterium]